MLKNYCSFQYLLITVLAVFHAREAIQPKSKPGGNKHICQPTEVAIRNIIISDSVCRKHLFI